MRALLLVLTLLPFVASAATLTNIPIMGLRATNYASEVAYLPDAQAFPGRATNDTFRVSVSDLFYHRDHLNVTNLQVFGAFGVRVGVEISLAHAGDNNITNANISHAKVTSPYSDATTARIRLSTNAFEGQEMTIENAGTDGTGWVLERGDQTWDSTAQYLILKGGNWATTNNGDWIRLLKVSNGWAEEFRGFGSSSQTNVVTGDSLWANTNGVTFLRPQYGATVTWGAATTNLSLLSDGLLISHDSSLGESQLNALTVWSTDNYLSPTNQSWFYTTLGSGDVVSAQLQLLAATNYQDPDAPISKFELNLDPRNGIANVTLINNGVTTFSVSDNSGYVLPGLRFLANDGTYWPQDSNVTAGLWEISGNALLPTDRTYPLRIMTNGAIIQGALAPAYYGFVTNSGLSVASYRDATQGDPNYNGFWYALTNTGVLSETWTELTDGETGFDVSFMNGSSRSLFEVIVSDGNPVASLRYNGLSYTYLSPGANQNITPYYFGTIQTRTNPDVPLAEFKNGSTRELTIGPGAQLGFGLAVSNSLALLDPDLVFTNYASQVQIGAINAAGDHAYLQANPDHSARLYAPDGYAALENASQIVRLNSTYFEPGTAGAVSLGGPNGNWWGDAGVTQVYVKGFDAPGGNHSWLTIYHGGTNDVIRLESQAAGTAGNPRPLTVNRNLGATLTVGDTGYVDLFQASQTNAVSGAVTISYATNGLDLVDFTHVRWFFNGSGSDQTLTIPSGWRTNVNSAVPSKLTNATITAMYVKCNGPTGSAALQTNCLVSFEFYK